MTNYRAGHDAEKAAASYLKSQGYKILSLNWQTRYCEIDIVAERDKTAYLVEVKYRQSADFGSGLEYITAKKLQQMTFAAELWIHSHKWRGPYQLSVIAITGPDHQDIEFLPDIT